MKKSRLSTILAAVGTVLVMVGLGVYFFYQQQHFETPNELAKKFVQVNPSTPPTILPELATKSAKNKNASPAAQLSFADANKQFGPCAVVPTLFYHHIQNLDQARVAGHAQLTVGTQFFQKQMQYLQDHNYQPITMQQLIHFFNDGVALPKKPVLITVDDAYDDFGSDALPILRAFHFPATLFVPTGLVENPGYLKWSTIADAAGSNIYIANHTWSHHGMAGAKSMIEREITLAETQLHERGYDPAKVFAYPYGTTSPYAESFLASQGFQVAFTTKFGATLCKKQRMELPRLRIGNSQLNLYGL